NETVNYELTKTVRQVRLPSGGIKRLSVAVVVDDKPVGDGGTGTGSQMQPRDPQELDRLRNLVMATVGYSAERGDSVTVENVSFSGVAPDAEQTPDPNFLQENWPYIQPALRYLLILVLFGLFYLFIFRPVRNRVFAFTEFSDPDYKQLAEATQDPELVQRLEEQMNRLSGGNQGALPEGNDFEGELQDSAAVKKQLTALAQKDPSLVTQVIRSWLSEGT
ncbi:MAG TPA: flagellar M-ring protein FliF C-terminal domain-containing protein, partial [Acidobacteriota bacterium]|nr:flagellar M-ring protein FliF C-terminal domain-containing protein [Acidobacteriota bacterium]